MLFKNDFFAIVKSHVGLKWFFCHCKKPCFAGKPSCIGTRERAWTRWNSPRPSPTWTTLSPSISSTRKPRVPMILMGKWQEISPIFPLKIVFFEHFFLFYSDSRRWRWLWRGPRCGSRLISTAVGTAYSGGCCLRLFTTAVRKKFQQQNLLTLNAVFISVNIFWFGLLCTVPRKHEIDQGMYHMWRRHSYCCFLDRFRGH